MCIHAMYLALYPSQIPPDHFTTSRPSRSIFDIRIAKYPIHHGMSGKIGRVESSSALRTTVPASAFYIRVGSICIREITCFLHVIRSAGAV